VYISKDLLHLLLYFYTFRIMQVGLVTSVLKLSSIYSDLSDSTESFLTLLTGSWPCSSLRPVRCLPRDS
jgi:hypothetical protein